MYFDMPEGMHVIIRQDIVPDTEKVFAISDILAPKNL